MATTPSEQEDAQETNAVNLQRTRSSLAHSGSPLSCSPLTQMLSQDLPPLSRAPTITNAQYLASLNSNTKGLQPAVTELGVSAGAGAGAGAGSGITLQNTTGISAATVSLPRLDSGAKTPVMKTFSFENDDLETLKESERPPSQITPQFKDSRSRLTPSAGSAFVVVGAKRKRSADEKPKVTHESTETNEELAIEGIDDESQGAGCQKNKKARKK